MGLRPVPDRPRSQPLRLRQLHRLVPKGAAGAAGVGSDDGAKVWLNGRVVHEAKVSRGYAPGQDKIPVTLTAGWNTVMLKVVQVGGGWVFSCVIGGPDGQVIDGLKFSTDEPAPQK